MTADPEIIEAYSSDQPVLRALGLRTQMSQGEYTSLGTVACEYGITVKVEVYAMPSMGWRFTLRIPQDTRHLHYGEDIRPFMFREIVFNTGTGRFAEFWPAVKMFADQMLAIRSDQIVS